ncbi:MAG: DotU family type IV/VI secretion system protein [Polaromonas sp.]|uniref:type IVB secretion system protein IcmH/DotU n=1 Tax=Polaromonas sp. TaxID=1869339 RepID=UPI00179D7EAD|nr:type IVB secretion system protein IcmH/DotU [Polaromonas sp.]NMM08673.1 DotU family type IV/VI secretion system protein [Polaromonas sp.]
MATPPSLSSNLGSFSETNASRTSAPDASRIVNSLVDLLYDGFYALFLLKSKNPPTDDAELAVRMHRYLAEFGRNAKNLAVTSEDLHLAKFAFCATADEIILRSQFKIRDVWERRPLQLTLFGEQLAGESFFTKLESLRAKGSAHVQVLEVYHMCLLLGFQGKYMIEGTEKLKYLTARLGDEIANMKGHRAPFAPHWDRPDKVAHQLKSETPLWVIGSVFALLALMAYMGLNSWLTSSTTHMLGGYEDLVKLAPRAANITITLP